MAWICDVSQMFIEDLVPKEVMFRGGLSTSEWITRALIS